MLKVIKYAWSWDLLWIVMDGFFCCTAIIYQNTNNVYFSKTYSSSVAFRKADKTKPLQFKMPFAAPQWLGKTWLFFKSCVPCAGPGRGEGTCPWSIWQLKSTERVMDCSNSRLVFYLKIFCVLIFCVLSLPLMEFYWQLSPSDFSRPQQPQFWALFELITELLSQ